MDLGISKRKPVLAAFTCSGELSKAGLLTVVTAAVYFVAFCMLVFKIE